LDKFQKNKFTASKKLSEIKISGIRQMNSLLKSETINLGLGQMSDFDPPKALLDAGIQAFKNKDLGYTENSGLLSLRNLIAKEHKVKPETVIVTNGAEQALYNVISSFIDPNDEVLIPEISYPAYDAIIKLNYGKAVEFKIDKNLKIDLKDLSSKINKKTKLIIINSPSNPCGVDYSELYEDLVSIVDKTNAYILSDEVYSKLYLNDKEPNSILEYSDKAIVVNSISKRAAATGLRLGWSIAPQEISDEIVKVQQYVSTCASSISQEAAKAVLSGLCLKDEKRYRTILKNNRDILLEGLSALKNIDFVIPSGGFYCFPDISNYGSSMDVSLHLLEEANILTIPGISFGQAGEGKIRISFAVNTDKLKKATKLLRQVLR
jgi:aspartate/methionine/tyrosine aminotransferase